jgi:hypothetical protein
MEVMRMGLRVAASAIQTSSKSVPSSFQRKAILWLSGDQTGGSGLVPMIQGRL